MPCEVIRHTLCSAPQPTPAPPAPAVPCPVHCVTGNPFAWFSKLYLGFLGFLLVGIILFLPLGYYSTFSPALSPNSVNVTSVNLFLMGDPALYTSRKYFPNTKALLARRSDWGAHLQVPSLRTRAV